MKYNLKKILSNYINKWLCSEIGELFLKKMQIKYENFIKKYKICEQFYIAIVIKLIRTIFTCNGPDIKNIYKDTLVFL